MTATARPANRTRFVLMGLLVAAAASPADAGVLDRAARAAASRFGRLLAREPVEQAADALARRVVARHGDDAVAALGHVGPDAARLIEQAGAHGDEAARLLARHGDDARRLVVDPGRLALCARHGDDASAALLRHGAVAEPLIAAAGRPAAEALAALSPRAARRLAILAEGGDLAKIGRTPELLSVVGRYGDRAMEFVWRRKGALAVSTLLAAFLVDPEPFLDGTRDLVTDAAGAVVRPVAAPATAAAISVARLAVRVVAAAVSLSAIAAAAAAFRRRARPADATDEGAGGCR